MPPAEWKPESAGLRQHERCEWGDDLSLDHAGCAVELGGNFYEPLSADLDAYNRNAIDLHVHCVVGNSCDVCVVLKHVPGVGIGGSLAHGAVWHAVSDPHGGESARNDRELFVSVAVRES